MTVKEFIQGEHLTHDMPGGPRPLSEAEQAWVDGCQKIWNLKMDREAKLMEEFLDILLK